LPETEANGVNLGLQLADGTQVQFASTARLATFLYSVAVQQMQATSFVTDNYNLDMQWLNTIDQPRRTTAPINRPSRWWLTRVCTATVRYCGNRRADRTRAGISGRHSCQKANTAGAPRSKHFSDYLALSSQAGAAARNYFKSQSPFVWTEIVRQGL